MHIKIFPGDWLLLGEASIKCELNNWKGLGRSLLVSWVLCVLAIVIMLRQTSAIHIFIVCFHFKLLLQGGFNFNKCRRKIIACFQIQGLVLLLPVKDYL